VQILQKATRDKIDDEIVLFVLQTICESMDITASSLETDVYGNDVRKISIGFFVFFLHTIYGCSITAVKKTRSFRLSRRGLYVYFTLIKNAKISKPKSSIDQIIAAKFNYLNNIFLNHHKTINHATERTA
jgi:hypothetical protein